MRPRHPAVAQFGMAIEREFFAALLLDYAIADIDAAIFHRVQLDTEIGTGSHFSAKFQVAGRSAKREIFNSIKRVMLRLMAQ